MAQVVPSAFGFLLNHDVRGNCNRSNDAQP